MIGGVCVRIPLCYIIQKYNVGLIELAFVCGIDRTIRAIYLRLYIKFNKLDHCYVIVVSLHEQNYPIKYYFK